MMRFDLQPHQGAGPIQLGMSEEQVRAVMGKPTLIAEKSAFDLGDRTIHKPRILGYFENEVQISIGEDGKAEFIEFYARGPVHTEVFLLGIDVLGRPALEVVEEIRAATRSDFDRNDPEAPTSFLFPSLDLALWRPCTEEDDPEDGKYFWSIGIGRKGYYQQRTG